MPDSKPTTLVWKRHSARIYNGYEGKEDKAMVFGAPPGMGLWAWVVWPNGGRGHLADYATSFGAAKRAAENALAKARGESPDAK